MRRVALGTLKYVAAILLALWVLVPIYFITLAAFSTEEAVYAYPKQLLPRDMSTDTMRFFLDSEGIVESLQRVFGMGQGSGQAASTRKRAVG